MEMGPEPKRRRLGGKPAPETKRSQYLCLDSSAITRIRVHFVVLMFPEVLRVSSWGSLALC